MTYITLHLITLACSYITSYSYVYACYFRVDAIVRKDRATEAKEAR